MATISASAPTSSVTHVGLVHKRPLGLSSSPVFGLPAKGKIGRVRCFMEESGSNTKMGMGASCSLIAAACAAAMSSPGIALVDERMSTEGTGLPFGLSNNLLGWILLGVSGLNWSFYTVYTSGLDENEECPSKSILDDGI